MEVVEVLAVAVVEAEEVVEADSEVLWAPLILSYPLVQ